MLNGTGDVRPAEFADVTDIGGEVFDESITINDAQRLEWRYFEALCAALWRKRFRAVQLTPPTGDGGVDVVAWTGSQGELVQAKTTAIEGGELNFDAVREIVAARPLYERKYPGIDFRLVCVTNQRFSASARELARVNGVCLVEAAELETLLAEHRLTMSDLYRLLGAESVT
jgi:HJR/Mrr/RecB family endonuclease